MLDKNKNFGAKNEVEVPSPSAKKKINYMNGKYFVVLDNRIINHFNISEDDDLWVQQTPSDDGITMKLLRKRWAEAEH
jgi:hypothetical protein